MESVSFRKAERDVKHTDRYISEPWYVGVTLYITV